MSTLSQQLLTAVLAAKNATLKEGYTNGGVAIQWDLQNSELIGSFRIHLTSNIDSSNGTYTVTAADFLQSLTSTPAIPPATPTPPGS